MCCFSGPVASVSNTQIFARRNASGSQMLVYQMDFSSPGDNAMILPLPVATPAKESSLRFIDLHEYEDFFTDLQAGFPVKPSLSLTRSKGVEVSAVAAAPLAVQEVGDYVASFVPSQADFARLDARFVIRPEVWAQIPAYADYGFAVFQLKQRQGRPHPMAFEFQTRLSDRVFFPTVHIHDGEVHAKEQFDHALYLQDPHFDAVVHAYDDHDVVDRATDFVRSDRMAGAFANAERSQGIVEAGLLVHRRDLRGEFANTDQIYGFPEAAILPPAAEKWGLRLGSLAVSGAGLAWIIARRQKRASQQRAKKAR